MPPGLEGDSGTVGCQAECLETLSDLEPGDRRHPRIIQRARAPLPGASAPGKTVTLSDTGGQEERARSRLVVLHTSAPCGPLARRAN